MMVDGYPVADLEVGYIRTQFFNHPGRFMPLDPIPWLRRSIHVEVTATDPRYLHLDPNFSIPRLRGRNLFDSASAVT
jgi:hypothetical protein